MHVSRQSVSANFVTEQDPHSSSSAKNPADLDLRTPHISD